MITRLESLTFDHDPVDKGHSALSVRRNASLETRVPEWVASPPRQPPLRGPIPPPQSSTVVYALARVRKRTVKVRARIYTDTPKRKVDISAKSKGILGGIPPTTVHLKSKYTDVLLPVSRVHATGVQRGIIDWEWSLVESRSRGLPVSLGRSEVPVYFVLDLPQPPWTQQSSSLTLPWLDLLRYAVEFGAGESAGDARWVLSRLVRRLCFDLDIRYDLANGGRPIYGFVGSGVTFSDTFNLTGYIENVFDGRLIPLTVCDPRDGTWPTPLSAGCYDMAAALVLLASALGIPATYQFVSPFGFLNPLRLVGHPEITNDNGWFQQCMARPPLVGLDDLARASFDQHTYVTLADGTLCDACLRQVLGELEEALLRLAAQQAAAAGDRVVARNATELADGLVIGRPRTSYEQTFIDRSTPGEADLQYTGGIPQPQSIAFV